MEATTPDGGTSMWYNSAYYTEPEAPHDVMESSEGVAWYAMKQHAEMPVFESGEDAYGYNQAQFREFMPGYERPITTVDGSGSSDGYFEVRHDDGSGTRFYDSTRYSAPRDRYQMYEDGTGGKWYAIHGEAAVERRPVYEDGMPVYDGDSVRSVSVETVRYRNMPQRLGEPTERPTWDIKPPNRRRS